MRSRRLPLAPAIVVSAAVLLVAAIPGCGVEPTGPQDPVPTDEIPFEEGSVQVGARETAIAFIEAYARTTTPDVEALTDLGGTPELRRWAHWIGVQNRELGEDAMTGQAQIRAVGPAERIEEASRDDPDLSTGPREVSLDAIVRFEASPDGEEPFEIERVFQGVRVFRGDDGGWLVYDFMRDDLPFSSVFQVLDDAVTRDDRGLEVRLDSFLAAPRWQFDLVVRAPGGGPALKLRPSDVRLIGPNDEVVARADVLTGSLRSIRPGSGKVEGIAGFQPLPTTEGLRLVLGFSASGDQRPVVIEDLGTLISAVAMAPGGGPV